MSKVTPVPEPTITIELPFMATIKTPMGEFRVDRIDIKYSDIFSREGVELPRMGNFQLNIPDPLYQVIDRAQLELAIERELNDVILAATIRQLIAIRASR